MFRYLLCLLGIIFALPVVTLIAFALTTPITISGASYLLACSLAITGMIMAPWRRKHYLTFVCSGVVAIILIACVRLGVAKYMTTSNLRIVMLPQESDTHWINYLIAEQDSVLFGEAILFRLGGVTPREHENIVSTLHAAYNAIGETEGIVPSPFARTYLRFQRPTSFDTVVVEPREGQQARLGVIFLHGLGGSVTIQCWQIAQASQSIASVTVCPSVGPEGNWWTSQGHATIHTTFNYLRERGIQKIYLGGYSNGGYGITLLASQLSTEIGLRGLFLISGGGDSASIKETGLPVLVIEGTQDDRIPATIVRQFAKEIRELGTYIELEGDHFLIMKQAKLVQSALAGWLEKRESQR